MVNVLAHDLKLWPASVKPDEHCVLREQLGPLFERYPGLRLLTPWTLPMRCGTCAKHSRPRTGVSGTNQGEPA